MALYKKKNIATKTDYNSITMTVKHVNQKFEKQP
jgi:hypothetical protein